MSDQGVTGFIGGLSHGLGQGMSMGLERRRTVEAERRSQVYDQERAADRARADERMGWERQAREKSQQLDAEMAELGKWTDQQYASIAPSTTAPAPAGSTAMAGADNSGGISSAPGPQEQAGPGISPAPRDTSTLDAAKVRNINMEYMRRAKLIAAKHGNYELSGRFAEQISSEKRMSMLEDQALLGDKEAKLKLADEHRMRVKSAFTDAAIMIDRGALQPGEATDAYLSSALGGKSYVKGFNYDPEKGVATGKYIDSDGAEQSIAMPIQFAGDEAVPAKDYFKMQFDQAGEEIKTLRTRKGEIEHNLAKGAYDGHEDEAKAQIAGIDKNIAETRKHMTDLNMSARGRRGRAPASGPAGVSAPDTGEKGGAPIDRMAPAQSGSYTDQQRNHGRAQRAQVLSARYDDEKQAVAAISDLVKNQLASVGEKFIVNVNGQQKTIRISE